MILFPAIDLYEGKAVRLYQGRYDAMTVYSEHPEEIAADFSASGMRAVHVVDLEGARDGGTPNLDAVLRIKEKSGGAFCEIGGGVRSMDVIERYLSAGLDRVILGTAAVEQPELLEKLAKTYPGQIAAGVDAKNGFVAIHGWRTVTDLNAFDFVSSMPERGVDTVIYTDIARDGLLSGPNFSAYEKLAGIPGLQIVASGGITTVEDLRTLAGMKLYAAIVGKAIYDGRIDVGSALRAAKEGQA